MMMGCVDVAVTMQEVERDDVERASMVMLKGKQGLACSRAEKLWAGLYICALLDHDVMV